MSTHNWVGQLTPVYCTSSGRVLLAFTDPARRGPLPADAALHQPDGDGPGRAGAGARRVRETGVARVCQEYEEGLNAIAAPVRDRLGSVVAALSVQARRSG